MPHFIVFIAALFLTSLPVHHATAQSLSSAQRDEINQLIKKNLKNNPEARAAALDNMQDYYREKSQKMEEDAVKNNRDKIIGDLRDPRFGPAKAKNVVVEFFDYNCGYCKRNFATIQTLMNGRDDTLFIFKELPILSATSEKAARIALSLSDKEDYRRLHKALMENKSTLDDRRLSEILSTLGLDEKKLTARSTDKDISKHIEDTRELASTLNITGTPSFYINGKIYKGLQSTEDMLAILNQ